ncbi:MAG TPA: helix-turn-helix transcriptional regulator [Solirubrobacter sp.]|nr:helix-turn-helix transcriptional regulator [Solirubrobacter sp.]
MSSERHEPSVRGYAVTHPPGRAELPIEPGWDQLLYTASGTMTVSTAVGSWTVPPRRALWVPDGAPVTVGNRFRVGVRSLYFAAALRALPPGPRAIEVTGFVRELLLHTVRACPLDAAARVDHALLTVLLDQLHRLPAAPLWLPLPTEPRAADAARLIAADPAADLTRVARAIGASRRTLERAFAADTGLTLGAWRRRSRILGALELLAAGTSVTETALAAGYSTPSAFVTAFRAELGRTPRDFLR